MSDLVPPSVDISMNEAKCPKRLYKGRGEAAAGVFVEKIINTIARKMGFAGLSRKSNIFVRNNHDYR